jgi:hypothetical protein
MDYGYECRESERIIDPILTDMATSIVRVYTAEGFVVAADGREYNPVTKSVGRDNCRKIFTISEERQRFTYAISGTNTLTFPLQKSSSLDLLPLLHQVLANLCDGEFENLEEYCTAACRAFRSLPARESDIPTILYLDGYWDGSPQRAYINIFHDGRNPERFPEQLQVGATPGCGSTTIFNMLDRQPSGPIAHYRSASWDVRRKERSLSDAIEIAKSWMNAHCSPEAKQIDPVNCVAIGGTAHLCINRPTKQFEWMFRDPSTQRWRACDSPSGPTIP